MCDRASLQERFEKLKEDQFLLDLKEEWDEEDWAKDHKLHIELEECMLKLSQYK